MALIKCPECGRERVSDSALACPECGFGVRDYVEEELEKFKNRKLGIFKWYESLNKFILNVDEL